MVNLDYNFIETGDKYMKFKQPEVWCLKTQTKPGWYKSVKYMETIGRK